MRTVKITLLALSAALVYIGCGGGEPPRPDAWASMEKNKMVRIATDAVNMPFEFGSGTGVQGFDVDLGEEIGKDLGYPVKWIKIPYARTFEILENGEVELVVSAVGITPERRQAFAFSEPYFDTVNTIARRRDKPEITDLGSLADKTVGVEELRTGDMFMENQKTAANVTLEKYPTLDDALGSLNRTEILAAVGDEAIITYSIYKSFPNLITTGTRLSDIQYGVVVRKDEKKLQQTVNETIARLKKSGELEKFREKWFQNVMNETAEEREKLKREEALKSEPKNITFVFIKSSSYQFDMSRLDGYTVTMVGDNGSYTSGYIITEGSRGSCKFPSPIPPGEYRMNMEIFRMTTTVSIPKIPARSITFDMNISSSGIRIQQR